MSQTTFIRLVMYKKIAIALRNYGIMPLTGSILGISGIDNFKPWISPNAKLTETSWPEINILSLPFPDRTFDVVITDQILEHVDGNPQNAVDESYRVLKPGGIAIHTTVFGYRGHHKHPVDYWRFTPSGLRYLCRNFSEIKSSGGWGNRYSTVLLAIFPKIANRNLDNKICNVLLWPIFRKNDPSFAHTVWIIAKK